MSLKRLREKLEIVDFVKSDIPPIAYKKNGKYYTNVLYEVEIDKSIIETNGIVVIKFKK